MIKRLPGWANFVLLYAAYCIVGEGLNFLFWAGQVPHPFIACICAFFCGAYLAKWRFYNGGWHFQ